MIIQVSDIEAAVNFYGQRFEHAGERVNSARHNFNCGTVILACVDPAAEGDEHTSQANPDHLYLAVPIVRDRFKRFSKALVSGLIRPGKLALGANVVSMRM